MGVIIPKLRQSARGQQCTFNTPHCCHDTESVVLCHIRDGEKAMGNKANDWSAAFGCEACHEAIDNYWIKGEERLFYCLRALQRTHKIWRDMGLIVIAGDVEKPRKPSSKIMPRRSLSKERVDG